MWLLLADTAEKLASGSEREILAGIVVVLSLVIAGLAVYIRKLLIDQKDELKTRDDAWSGKLQTAQADLAREREERRKEILSTMTDVLSTNTAQQQAIDRCTQEISRVSDLVKGWQEE